MNTDLTFFEKFMYMLPNVDNIVNHETMVNSCDISHVIVLQNQIERKLTVTWHITNDEIMKHKLKIHSTYRNFLAKETVEYDTGFIIYKASFNLPSDDIINTLYKSAFEAAFTKDLEYALSE